MFIEHEERQLSKMRNKQYLKIALICFVIAAIGIYLMGCVSSIPKRVSIKVPSFTVTFCPSGDAALPSPYVAKVVSFSDGDYIIYVFGGLENEKIITHFEWLGHELMHILNWEDNRIANPDKWR